MQCPYYKEEIKDGAIKCRYCNEFIFIEPTEEWKEIAKKRREAEAKKLMGITLKTILKTILRCFLILVVCMVISIILYRFYH